MPFKVVKLNESKTLSEIIKAQGWGANKIIYHGGVRITNSLKLWADWEIIIKPSHVINKNCFIGTAKGKEIVKIVMDIGG